MHPRNQVCKRIQKNGEPGFAWLENMRTHGRMGDEKNDRDAKAMGGNPCLEQTLESFEMCCLVETFPGKHESLEDFLTTLRLDGSVMKLFAVFVTNAATVLTGTPLFKTDLRRGCERNLSPFFATIFWHGRYYG